MPDQRCVRLVHLSEPSYRLPVIITRTDDGDFDITWDYEVMCRAGLRMVEHVSVLGPEHREGLHGVVVRRADLPADDGPVLAERPVLRLRLAEAARSRFAALLFEA